MSTRQQRCRVCQKKVGWEYYECKCDVNAKFCAAHRYPFTHACTIDKAQTHKQQLTQNNPRVAPAKV